VKDAPLGTIGTIVDKLCGFILEQMIIRWVELKGVRVNGQACSREARSTLDHILTVHSLIEQDIFVGQCLYSCFVHFKKAFDMYSPM
jgi:hypothetical protein